jgi:ankyrin repeat protein
LGQISVDLGNLKQEGPTFHPLSKKKDKEPRDRGEVQLTIEGVKKQKKALNISEIEKEMGIDLSIQSSPHSSFDPSNHLNEINQGNARIRAGEVDAGTFALQPLSLEIGVVKFSWTKDSATFDLWVPRSFSWTRVYTQHAYCRGSLQGITKFNLRPLHRLRVSFADDSNDGGVAIGTVEGKAINEEDKNVVSVKAVFKVEKAQVKKLIDEDDVYEKPTEYPEGELLDACQKGLPDKVKMCLNRWDDVNVKNENDETPLHKAVTNGNLDIIKLLVERGAEPRTVDKFGSSPIDIAEKYFKNDLIPILRTYQ